MRYPILKSSDTHNLERKSSISQHGGFLAVYRQGEICPLVFDVVDGVSCGHLYTHRAGLTDKPVIGYTFPVGTCKYVSELYLMAHQDEVVKKKLPEWFGVGFYDERIKKDVFLNSDREALGLVQEHTLRVGKDYVVAKTLLTPAQK